MVGGGQGRTGNGGRGGWGLGPTAWGLPGWGGGVRCEMQSHTLLLVAALSARGVP